MRFRRCASLIDAVRLDGTEASIQAALAMPSTARTKHGGGIVVRTPFGLRTARDGQWISRDATTTATRIYDHGSFLAEHEVLS